MFIDAFIKCSPDEIISFLKDLDQNIKNHGFKAPGLILLKKPIAFYPSCFYYDVTQADQHPSKTNQIIKSENRFFICDGNVDHLNKINHDYPLMLDRSLIIDYTRFYFAHIVGVHGLSKIIDTVDDLHLKEEPTPALRKSLHDKIIPLALNAALAGGGYQLRATLLVEQTIFSTFIDINPKGQVKVELGRVLADLLPTSLKILES